LILEEIAHTKPLSIKMIEKIEPLPGLGKRENRPRLLPPSDLKSQGTLKDHIDWNRFRDSRLKERNRMSSIEWI